MLKRRANISFDNIVSGLKERRQFMTDQVSKTTVRAWLRHGLLPGGIEPSHGDMVPARMLEIIDRYPTLYRHADEAPGANASPFAYEGLAVGAGWLDIANRLSAKLTVEPNLVVGQFKEKYGLLTVYFDPGPPSAHEEELDRAIDEAQVESIITCERCGRPGVLAERGHHMCVLCGECATSCST